MKQHLYKVKPFKKSRYSKSIKYYEVNEKVEIISSIDEKEASPRTTVKASLQTKGKYRRSKGIAWNRWLVILRR